MNGLDFPDISPVIFSIGPVDVRWYSMAYLAGIVIGWILISRNVKRNNLGLSKENIEDLVRMMDLTLHVTVTTSIHNFQKNNMEK